MLNEIFSALLDTISFTRSTWFSMYNDPSYQILWRWVASYPQCRYIFCYWLHCWLSVTQYTRWFKYDRDWFVCKQAALSPGHIWTTLYMVSLSPKIVVQVWPCQCISVMSFMPSCHLHKRIAVSTKPYLMGWRYKGIRDISAVWEQWCVTMKCVWWIERFKNSHTSIKHEEGAKPARKWCMHGLSQSPKLFILKA